MQKHGFETDCDRALLRSEDMRETILGLLAQVLDRLTLLDAVACGEVDEIADTFDIPRERIEKLLKIKTARSFAIDVDGGLFWDLHADVANAFTTLHDMEDRDMRSLAECDYVAREISKERAAATEKRTAALLRKKPRVKQ